MEQSLLILKDLLKGSYTDEEITLILDGLKKNKHQSFRVNTLLSTNDEIEKNLKESKYKYHKCNFYDAAYILDDVCVNLENTEFYQNGYIYMQSLSSMLPPLVMDIQDKENILDMTAAPGGKTTEMYNLSGGKSLITAVEKDKFRYEKLRYNITKQGATRVNVLNADALKLSDYLRFDKILLDAPCSGSGTLNENSKFSKRLVEKSIVSQKKLIEKALNILNDGGILVYSTCSVLKEENEDIIKPFIDSGKVVVEEIDLKIDDSCKLRTKIPGTLSICPNEYFEGFFVAKLRKI